jgi:hypothetical protein
MDGAIVEHVFPKVRANIDEYSGTTAFKPPVQTDSEYAHDQLLALLGRDPFLKRPESD